MDRHYILFDTPARALLYPFTHTRPVAACRIGILTIKEKWERWLNASAGYLTQPYLQEKYPLPAIPSEATCVLINGHILPDAALVASIRSLETGQELYQDQQLIASVVAGKDVAQPAEGIPVSYTGVLKQIRYPWDIFRLNDAALREDFKLLTQGRTSAPVPESNRITGGEQIFLEEGAMVEHSILNAATGPIYIAKGAEVMEGCLVRGPLALCEGAVLKMGTRIYGATTLGPGSVGGGEIKNVVMFGYSNKGHDGYLGDSVIGEWCNLGGNTTNSNLKNNAGIVKVWVEAERATVAAGTKCGLLMGDYSRSGIGTMFNTGSVIGVSCNIFGGDFPPKFVPSFSWGGVVPGPYRLEEAIRDAGQWMQFKGQQLGAVEERLLKSVFQSVNS